MKKLLVWIGLGCLAFLPACATTGARLAIDPVGPRLASAGSPAGVGSLVVYSASAPFNDNYTEDHSSYKILASDGTLIRRVHNYIVGDFTDEPPSNVQLPAGTYTVRAESQDYGLVNVPVVIRGGETTRVYLDCSSQPANLRAARNTVKLPDGQVIGWSASL
jgi:hypothetical protein